MEASFATIATRLDEIIANFPVRPVAWLIRFLIQPLGPRRRGPPDRVTTQCAAIIASPGPARDRLTTGLFKATTEEGEHVDGVALIERAFAMTISVQSIRDRMHAAHTRDIDQAAQQRTITAEEACPGGIDLPRRVQQGRCVIASHIAAPDGHGIERCPVYIIDGSRTPFIKARGKPGNIPPYLVIPVVTQHYAMLQPNGVTRGKRLVVLVGQKKADLYASRHSGEFCAPAHGSSWALRSRG
jgi:hypothetical protein